MIQCRKCCKVKPIDGFGTRGPGRGKEARCRECERDAERAAYARARAARTEYQRAYRESNYARLRRQEHDRRLRREYGLTSEGYERLYLQQHGCCGGCNRPLIMRAKQTHVDHCHDSGRVRGLLCYACNAALGLVRDNKVTLRQLAGYLTDTE